MASVLGWAWCSGPLAPKNGCVDTWSTYAPPWPKKRDAATGFTSPTPTPRFTSSTPRYPIDRLEERGVERGSAQRSFWKRQTRAIVSQTNIETVSKATLGKLLRERGAYTGFPEHVDKYLNWTKLPHRCHVLSFPILSFLLFSNTLLPVWLHSGYIH